MPYRLEAVQFLAVVVGIASTVDAPYFWLLRLYS